MKITIRFVPVRILSYGLTLLIAAASIAQTNSSRQFITRSTAFLAAEPEIQVRVNGKVDVTILTREPCSGGEAFLGLVPAMAEFDYPIYRLRGNLEGLGSQRLTARFDLKELELPALDINNVYQRQGSSVALRFQLFGKKLNVIDRSFAYEKSPEEGYTRVPALVEGPFVDWVTDSCAVLSWAFDQPTSCQLQVHPEVREVKLGSLASRYEIPLKNLRPDSLYSYSISWPGKAQIFSSRTYRFRTAPRRGSDKSFRFAVLSDGRGAYGGGLSNVEGVNQQILIPLLEQIYHHEVSFILYPGDLVTGSAGDRTEIETQFRSFKRTVVPLGAQVPIYEGVGNHDLLSVYVKSAGEDDFLSPSGENAGEVIFAEQFVNPTDAPKADPDAPPYNETVYSFDWGNAHVSMLNTNYFKKGAGPAVADLAGELEGMIRPEQLDWLQQDLQSARQRGLQHLFVLGHEPAFPTGGHASDAMWWEGKRPEFNTMRDCFWKILCRYHVLAAFFGHEHNYSRLLVDSSVNPDFDVPLWQIVTGGAGAPFYAQDPSVPWAKQVGAFYPLPHFCLLEVSGEAVWLTVMSLEETQVDKINLLEKK